MKYTLEFEDDIKHCYDCRLLGDRSNCVLLDVALPVEEQFKNCPLTKVESSHEKVETDDTFSYETVEISHEKVNGGEPFISFSESEIRNFERLGGTIKCRICGEIHTIAYGKTENKDGTFSESDVLQYTVCADGKAYLVGIDGKKINRWG